MQVSIKNIADYKKIASQIKGGKVEITPEEINRLRLEKERIEKERIRQEMLEKICEQSEIDIPQDTIERERNSILDNLKRQVAHVLQIAFEDYLKKINKTEQELSESMLPEAKKRIAGFLVLKAIADKENIQVSEEELDKEKEAICRSFPDAKNIDQSQLKEYTENIIRNEKVFQILENL